jgi:hypothetical protein
MRETKASLFAARYWKGKPAQRTCKAQTKNTRTPNGRRLIAGKKLHIT